MLADPGRKQTEELASWQRQIEQIEMQSARDGIEPSTFRFSVCVDTVPAHHHDAL